jgi:hypothetical protein
MNRWRALDIVLNAGWLWAGVGVLAGRVQRDKTVAALTATADVFLTVLTYWVVGSLQAEGTLGLASLTPHIRAWLFIAVVAGPPLGLAGFWARRGGISGLAARLLIPAAIVMEELIIHPLDRAAFPVDPWLSWTHAAMAGLAVVWAVVVLAWWWVAVTASGPDSRAR